jgi:uncharacterized protein (TIGR03435 family)
MKDYFLLFFFFFITFSGSAQVLVGKKVPQIDVDLWVENPNYQSASLEGKAIVLDFWFTSCAPCVYTIPHLNELSEKYAGEKLAFVAVTFEEEKKIAPFLRKKKLLAQIASDVSHKIIDDFGVQMYPTTFLIDEKGILRWVGYPSNLTAEMLEAVIQEGTVPSRATPSLSNVQLSAESFPKDIYQIEVKRNDYMDSGARGFQRDGKELNIVNSTLKDILADLLDISKPRVYVLDSSRYDVRFKTPEGFPHHRFSEIVGSSLLEEMKYSKRTQTKMVNGYELQLQDGDLFISNAIDTTKIYSGHATSETSGHWRGSGVGIDVLIRELENCFNVLIANGTKLNGYFELSFPIGSFDQARKELQEVYGLEIGSAEFEIEEIHIVDKSTE